MIVICSVFIFETKDLIHEGIATPLVCGLYRRLCGQETKDLIHEGIATMCRYGRNARMPTKKPKT